MYIPVLGLVLFERLVELELTLHPLYLAALLFRLDDHFGHVAPVDVPVVFEANLHQPTLLLPLGQALRQKSGGQLNGREVSA